MAPEPQQPGEHLVPVIGGQLVDGPHEQGHDVVLLSQRRR